MRAQPGTSPDSAALGVAAISPIRFVLEVNRVRASVRWASVALLCIPHIVWAQHATRRDAGRDVLHTDSLRLNAVLRADTVFLSRVLTPDWLLISGVTGERLSRHAYLVGVATGRRRLANASHDSLQVRVHGTTAVLTGRSVARVRRDDSTAAVTARFTHVYVREGGEWRMLSMHVSPDPPTRPAGAANP